VIIPAPGWQPITVRISDTQPCCPRCGQQALMCAYVPHGWDNEDGAATRGTIPVVLCAQCNAGEPEAGALITFFHVHGEVDASAVIEFASLAQAWVASITIPPVDMDRLNAEIRAWQENDL
jgi:hypothetical protein